MYTAPTLRRPGSPSSSKLPMCGVEGEGPSPFSGGSKGGILFGKRIPPLSRSSAGGAALCMPLLRIRRPLLREPHKIIHARVVKPRQPNEHIAWDIPFSCLVIGIADLRAAQIVGQTLLRQIAVFSQVSNAPIHFTFLHPGSMFRFCQEVYVKRNVILHDITKCYIIFNG